MKHPKKSSRFQLLSCHASDVKIRQSKPVLILANDDKFYQEGEIAQMVEKVLGKIFYIGS